MANQYTNAPRRQAYFCSPMGSWVVPLTQGKLALISVEDVPATADANWYIGPSGYAVKCPSNRVVFMHRHVLLACGMPSSSSVDHINGDRLDNRRENLRACTIVQNTHNMKLSVRNTSGVKGVSLRKADGMWLARVQVNHIKFCQSFKLKSEAEAWARAKREELHGDFTRHG